MNRDLSQVATTTTVTPRGFKHFKLKAYEKACHIDSQQCARHATCGSGRRCQFLHMWDLGKQIAGFQSCYAPSSSFAVEDGQGLKREPFTMHQVICLSVFGTRSAEGLRVAPSAMVQPFGSGRRFSRDGLAFVLASICFTPQNYHQVLSQFLDPFSLRRVWCVPPLHKIWSHNQGNHSEVLSILSLLPLKVLILLAVCARTLPTKSGIGTSIPSLFVSMELKLACTWTPAPLSGSVVLPACLIVHAEGFSD